MHLEPRDGETFDQLLRHLSKTSMDKSASCASKGGGSANGLRVLTRGQVDRESSILGPRAAVCGALAPQALIQVVAHLPE